MHKKSTYFEEKQQTFTFYLMKARIVATEIIFITTRNDNPAIKGDSLQLLFNPSICKLAERIENNHWISQLKSILLNCSPCFTCLLINND